MQTEANSFSVAALDLRRYDVPAGAVCTVRVGCTMTVSAGFVIDGILILEGMLGVSDD